MRLRQLSLTGFKGVEITLTWQRANVLFGPNDAGKTNVLEAVASAFGSGELVRPSARSPSPRASALLHLGPEKYDDQVLAALLRWRHVPPLFPAATPRGWSEVDVKTADPAPARLKWAAAERGGRSFVLTASVEPSDPDPLDVVHSELTARVLTTLRSRLKGDEARSDVEGLLTAAIEAGYLLFDRSTVTLLCPAREDCHESAVTAAERLAASGWRDDRIIGPMVKQLADGLPDRQPLLRMLDRRSLRLFDIVWAAAEGSGDQDVDRALRREFDRWYSETARLTTAARDLLRIAPGPPELLDYLKDLVRDGKISANTTPDDRWLRNFPMSDFQPARWVGMLTGLVTEEANRLAAPIVRESGWLNLDILPPRYWLTEDRRLEGVVFQDHRDQPTRLRDLGLGVRTWAAIALIEAATEQRQDDLPFVTSYLRGMQARTEPSDSGSAHLPVERQFGRRHRLLIVDEPEQHLHLRAQREIAAWLATGADQRDTLLATHALPFVDLPFERSAYVLVTRHEDGITRGLDISNDVFRNLDKLSREAGLSGRAEALQTLRAVCLVEGRHDECVLRHFFGKELARHRILVVPTRGARNVNALVDTPWLSRVHLPIVILFDDVHASRALGRTRPGGRDVAGRAVWDLLAHWDESRPRPAVASFDLPDIFRALPESCVDRTVGNAGGRFPGWDAIDARFQQQGGSVGYKKVFLERSGLAPDTDLDVLLDELLATCRSRPHRSLQKAVREVIDLSAHPLG